MRFFNSIPHIAPLSIFSLIFIFSWGAVLAQTSPGQKIPIEINGKTFHLEKGLSRQAIMKATRTVFTVEPSVDDEETLQFDVVLAQEQAPVTFAFSFDKEGMIFGLLIDSFEKEQNPAVQTLAAWLTANAGKPFSRMGQSTWRYGCWKIVHRFGGTGEDSTFSMEFSLEK